MLERKRHNPGNNAGKLYERIINERVNERVKNVTEMTEAQAGGITGSATADHITDLKKKHQRTKKKGCTESLRQGPT